MVRRSRRHTKQHSGIWSQRLSSVLSLPTIPSSALPGCTSPTFRTQASVLNLLSHLCAAYRVGSIVKCFSVRVKMNVHMKTKRWDIMINGAHEAVVHAPPITQPASQMKLVIGALCPLLCFWTRKKKKKKKLKATETSLVIGRFVFGGFVPHGSHTDIWHVPLYLLQTQTLCVWRECSHF